VVLCCGAVECGAVLQSSRVWCCAAERWSAVLCCGAVECGAVPWSSWQPSLSSTVLLFSDWLCVLVHPLVAALGGQAMQGVAGATPKAASTNVVHDARVKQAPLLQLV